MVHAEKKCCPLKMGEVDFSPDVNTAKGRHFVWQMIIHKRRGKCVSLRKIRHVAKAVGIVETHSAIPSLSMRLDVALKRRTKNIGS
jgi:hypothetical protein